MPFNVNNIDVTVAANGIYGITNGVLSNLLPNSLLDDPDIQVGETGFLKEIINYAYNNQYCFSSLFFAWLLHMFLLRKVWQLLISSLINVTFIANIYTVHVIPIPVIEDLTVSCKKM